MSVRDMTALAALLSGGKISSRELTEACLAAMEREAIGAYITPTPEPARAAARAADARLAAGDAPPLCGIPYALKDNICTCGIPTTCASRMLKSYVPPYSAAVYERLSAQGAVLLGKCNMDEFSMGSSTETSCFGPCRNPRNTECVPGGSSGGCAAAVAAGQALFALGSDTGGSLRQPAAFCGLVGMRPTYGTVSRRGLVAFASSLDQIGPLTLSVRDSAAVLEAIAGSDAGDGTCHGGSGGFGAAIGEGVHGLRIGLLRDTQAADPSVCAAVEAAARELARAGARTVEVSVPCLADALPAYYMISSAEASANLARYDGLRFGLRGEAGTAEAACRRARTEGFGDEVRRRILLGTFVLSAGHRQAYYGRALAAAGRVRAALAETFADCDLLLYPAAPTVAYPLGRRRSPVEIYREDVFSAPAALAGLPALSLPCGRGEHGLPVGAELCGPAGSEALLYRVGAVLEEVCDHAL